MALQFKGGRAVSTPALNVAAIESLMFKIRDHAKRMYKERIDPNAQDAEGFVNTKFYYVSQAKKTGDIEELRNAFVGGSTSLLAMIGQLNAYRQYAAQRRLGPAVDMEWGKLIDLANQLRSAVEAAGVRLTR